MRKIILFMFLMLLSVNVYSYTCLTFDTEAKALVAEKVVWGNYIKSYTETNIECIGNAHNNYNPDEILNMPDGELWGLRIWGRHKGVITPNVQKSCPPWSITIKAYELNKWYFVKPPEELIIGVVDYQEEEKQIEWNKPLEM